MVLSSDAMSVLMVSTVRCFSSMALPSMSTSCRRCFTFFSISAFCRWLAAMLAFSFFCWACSCALVAGFWGCGFWVFCEDLAFCEGCDFRVLAFWVVVCFLGAVALGFCAVAITQKPKTSRTYRKRNPPLSIAIVIHHSDMTRLSISSTVTSRYLSETVVRVSQSLSLPR